MSLEKPILDFIKKDGESMEKSYIRELEERVKDLVEIKDHWKNETKKNETISKTINESFEMMMDKVLEKL